MIHQQGFHQIHLLANNNLTSPPPQKNIQGWGQKGVNAGAQKW